jgi:hypothetical protein
VIHTGAMTAGTAPTWALERGVFSSGDETLRAAIVRSGGTILEWNDAWLADGRLPDVPGAVVFHGSLANADWIVRETDWRPGAFCATGRFACSSWHPAVRELLLTPTSVLTTVSELVATGAPESFGDRVFVRPDSALKPFSGRVLERASITLESLDHGFYYDDADLPVIVSPVVEVRDEWRLVVIDGAVVAGSGYAADGRTAGAPLGADHPAWVFGAGVLESLPLPEPAFIMDVGEGPDGLRLVELNPFSGADFYSCDPDAIVHAVNRLLSAAD